MSKKRRRHKKRRDPNRRRRRVFSRPVYFNIFKDRPNNFFADLYVKNVVNIAISKKPLKPFELSEEFMEEFTPILESVTSFREKKSFKHIVQELEVDRTLKNKDKKLWKNKMKIRRNLLEEVVTESVTDILEYVKDKMTGREISNPYHISHYLLQTCTVLKKLAISKHLRELTVSNKTVEIFSSLLQEEMGYGERLFVLDILCFLASHAYLGGVDELRKRFQQRKEREKQLKEKKEKEKKEKQEEKEKERKKKLQRKKKKKGDDNAEEDEEEKSESESEEEESEEEDDDDDDDDLEEDEVMKRLQARRHIKDDDLFESIENLRETMTTLEFLENLSNIFYLPSKRVNIVCCQLSLKIVFKLLQAGYEDRSHFDSFSYYVVMGKKNKDINFTDHFYNILNEFSDSHDDEEEEGEEEQEGEEDEEQKKKKKKKTMNFNKDRHILSYVLSSLFYISYNPSKKIHRKLTKVYDKLIEILQSQSDKYVKSKPKKSTSGTPTKGKRKRKQPQSTRVKLDWSLITSICSVISNLGGVNPHLARYFADCVTEDLIHLLEYAHYCNLENLEVYSALTVLLGTCKALEMKQYLEDYPIMRFVARDLRQEKKVEMVYPPLLCFKTILSVLTTSSSSDEDKLYSMKLVMDNLKAVERVFRFGHNIMEWRVPPKQIDGGQQGSSKKKRKKQQKQKNLSEDEMKKRDKENKFAWPCVVTSVNMIHKCMTSRPPSDLRGLERGMEEYNKMTEKFPRSYLLVDISHNISRMKKKAFSYKSVTIFFIIVLAIILLLPTTYYLLGLGKKKDEMDEDGGGGEDF